MQCDRISSLLPWSASDCHHRLYHRFPEHYFCLISQSGYQQLCRITIRSNLFQSKSPFVSNIADLLITTERASIMFSMTSSEVFISIRDEDRDQMLRATGYGAALYVCTFKNRTFRYLLPAVVLYSCAVHLLVLYFRLEWVLGFRFPLIG